MTTVVAKDGKEAQVNEATLFRQFGSKKELLLTTLKEADGFLLLIQTSPRDFIGIQSMIST